MEKYLNLAKSVLFRVAGLLSLGGVVCLGVSGRIERPNATDGSYTVRGQATYDTFGRGAHYTFTFTLTVSNDCWAMEGLPVEAPGIGEKEVFDGVNSLFWHHYDTNRIDRSKVSKWTDGYMRIDDNNMPAELTVVGPAIWVAYAAQFYLPAGTNGLLRPFWHPDREVRNNAFVAAYWRLLSLESKLPDSIDFFYDEAGWDKALRRGQKQSTSTNPSDEPIPVATYQSVGKTNLGRWAFPQACVLTGFAAEKEHETGERLPVTQIEVTNVTVSPTVENRLFDTFFRGVGVVEDYRGQQGIPLSYEITNSAPPGLSDGRRLAAVRQALQLELAMKRKEVLASDWAFRIGDRRFGLRVFKPFDGRGGRRYAIHLGKAEYSFGDDRARTHDRPRVSFWCPALVLLVIGGLAIRLWSRRSPGARQGGR